jgi:GH3 auxin-responsive promoter
MMPSSFVHSQDLARELVGDRAAFLALTQDPARQQAELLQSILRRNEATKVGARYGFSSINSVAQFQAAVPITTYSQIAADIYATGQGGENLLISGRALVMEPTGGSGASDNSGIKLIPYSAQSLVEFQSMVRPWLDDIFQTFPGLASCSAYWSISPPSLQSRPFQSDVSIAIGLPTDAHYLGAALGEALFRSLSVPPSVGTLGNHDEWAIATLCYLLADENLGLVSVWSPTFWLDLTTRAIEQSKVVLAAFEASGIPISDERFVFLQEQLPRANFSAIWPKLKLISCWADGSAKAYIEALQARFPLSLIQGKGLLATEGAMSFPLMTDSQKYQHVVALNSGFFEFLPINKVATIHAPLKLCHELTVGAQYRIVLTNSSGLYRYDIGDEVEVTGYFGKAPCLKFLGRGASTVDLCGEKLSESFVGQVIAKVLLEFNSLLLSTRHNIRCAVLTPVANLVLKRGYQLVVDSPLTVAQTDLLCDTLDAALKTNPQYAYARNLNQLQAVQVLYLPKLQQLWMNRALGRGQQLGDIKPPVLTQDIAWLENRE